jgi:hypothetical protein
MLHSYPPAAEIDKIQTALPRCNALWYVIRQTKEKAIRTMCGDLQKVRRSPETGGTSKKVVMFVQVV